MKKSVAVLTVILLTAACKKAEVSTMDTLAEKTGFLTAGVWHFTGFTDRSSIISTDIITYSALPACRQDDLRSFNNDGTGEVNEGPTKCNSSDPQSIPVQWSFVNGETRRINISGTEYTINRLDDTSFEFSGGSRNYIYSR